MKEGTKNFENMPERPAVDRAVLTPYEFLRDLKYEAVRAKEEIIVQTMSLEPDEVGDAILDIYKNVPTRVRKELYVDWYSKLIFDQKVYSVNSKIPILKQDMERRKENSERLFEKLTSIGVNLVLTNPPRGTLERLLPLFGRSHIKGTSIDNRIFYLGGLNLTKNAAESAEFMVKFTGELAEKLVQEFGRLHTHPLEEDYVRSLDSKTELYVDAGKPGESVILKKAVELVRNAKESIENVSLFVPDGAMARALVSAHEQGRRVEVLTSLRRLERVLQLDVDNLMTLVDQVNRARLLFQKTKIPIFQIPFRGVHAKLLIVDGEIAMFGSHNLSESGVRVGTREWMLLTRDKELVENLLRQYRDFRLESSSKIAEVF